MRSAVQLIEVVVVALALVLVLVSLLVVLAVLRRTRPPGSVLKSPTRTSARDAWAEAGKRAEPETKRFVVDEHGQIIEAPSDGTPLPVRNAQNTPDGRRPVAVVTGGSKRVGLAIATALARAGCDLVITYLHSADDAAHAADELCQLGVAVRTVRVDLGDPAETDRVGGELAGELKRVDVLVHNASVYEKTPLEAMEAPDAERAWRVNALAPLLLTRRLAPRLKESPLPAGGSVVAMLDIHALGLSRAGYSAYAMSKAALAEMVRSLARELAPDVRVNGVAPGVVSWPETGPESRERFQAEYLARVPLGRAGEPEEAAEAVRWLALDAAYVTGQIIRVDGGRSTG